MHYLVPIVAFKNRDIPFTRILDESDYTVDSFTERGEEYSSLRLTERVIATILHAGSQLPILRVRTNDTLIAPTATIVLSEIALATWQTNLEEVKRYLERPVTDPARVMVEEQMARLAEARRVTAEQSVTGGFSFEVPEAIEPVVIAPVAAAATPGIDLSTLEQKELYKWMYHDTTTHRFRIAFTEAVKGKDGAPDTPAAPAAPNSGEELWSQEQVITDRAMIIGALTSFMPNAINVSPMGFQFALNGRAYLISGWLPRDLLTLDTSTFAILMPEAYTETTPSVDYKLGATETIKSRLFGEIECREALESKSVSLDDQVVGNVFRDYIDGIILSFGEQPEWTDAQSVAFLDELIPRLHRAHGMKYPIWVEGSPLSAIMTHFDRATRQQTSQVETELEGTRGTIAQYEGQLANARAKVTGLERELATIKAQLETKDSWAQGQLDVMRVMPELADMRVSESGDLFLVKTKPITYTLGGYEYYFGEYQLEIGVDGPMRNTPIKITNLSGDQHGYVHPHSSDGGNWCFSTTQNHVELAWANGDIGGCVAMLVQYLKNVTLSDSYAQHLAWFKRRKAGTSDAYKTPDRNGWPDTRDAINVAAREERDE